MPRANFFFLFSYVSTLSIGIAIGITILKFWGSKTPTTVNSFRETRLQHDYRFINPLLECDAEIGFSVFPRELKDKVLSYLQQEQRENRLSSYAVYYRDLNNGPWFGINDQELFTPASLIKVPLLMAYYKQAEKNTGILEKKILLPTGTHLLVGNQSYSPKQSLVEGKEYTIGEYLKQMIMYSDNAAYTVLKKNLGEEAFAQLFSDFGIDVTSFSTKKDENVLSITDYSAFFRILYNSSYLGWEYSEKALALLSTTTFSDGIVAGIPASVPVAHKFGERDFGPSAQKQLHDCGIIYAGSNPYMLCVMTRGVRFEDLTSVIRKVSELVYQGR